MPHPEETDFKQLIFGSVFVMLLLAISIIVFFIVYQKRLLAQQLRLQQVKNDFQRELLASSIEAQENERVRIGRDLHDEIGSSLSAIKMLFNQLQPNDEASVPIISNAKDMLSNTIQDVRNISNNLFPSVLAKFGLADALHHLVSVLSGASVTSIELATDDSFTLNFEMELAIYRIVQELANNTLKHAKANSLNIEVRQLNNQVLVVVKDNGCGFDTAIFHDFKQSGIGLKSIQTRTAIMQANLQISSQKSEGTQIKISIPLANS